MLNDSLSQLGPYRTVSQQLKMAQRVVEPLGHVSFSLDTVQMPDGWDDS